MFHIGDRKIGEGEPTYIIAEMSANHNHNYELAEEMVRVAAEAGADAVKLQTYTADTLTIDSDKDWFKIRGTLWENETFYKLYQKAYTPWDWHEPLKKLANELGIDLFSTPFDSTAVDFLVDLDVPVIKVASFEVSDHVLLKKIGQTGKPVIMSTGTSNEQEITEAVQVLRTNGTTDLCLLKCTSAYPAKLEDANLATIPYLKQRFNVCAGISDHTPGWTVPVVATALGAHVIEKHYTMSRDIETADAAFSLEPNELKEMIQKVRTVEKAIGKPTLRTLKSEEKTRTFRKSLFVVKDIRKGEVLTEEHIRPIRPGFGCHTKHYWSVLGKKVNQDLERGTPFRLEFLE